jgi:hypothetical protein
VGDISPYGYFLLSRKHPYTTHARKALLVEERIGVILIDHWDYLPFVVMREADIQANQEM